MKMKTKKKIFALALVAICLSLVAYGTLAYFTDVDRATNVITMGTVDIDIEEWSKSEDSETLKPFVGPIGVLPGQTVSKIVQIKNIGTGTAYVRVSLEKIIELAEDRSGEVDLSLISYDINSEDWTLVDGYYYYNKPLQPNSTTTPLLKNVIFANNMDNMYQHSKVTIKIAAEATQAANNGTDALTAAGWSSVN